MIRYVIRSANLTEDFERATRHVTCDPMDPLYAAEHLDALKSYWRRYQPKGTRATRNGDFLEICLADALVARGAAPHQIVHQARVLDPLGKREGKTDDIDLLYTPANGRRVGMPCKHSLRERWRVDAYIAQALFFARSDIEIWLVMGYEHEGKLDDTLRKASRVDSVMAPIMRVLSVYDAPQMSTLFQACGL